MKEKQKGISYVRLFRIFGFLSLLVVVLIVAAIVSSDSQTLSDIFKDGAFVHSETVYITMVLALLLPSALIAMTVIILKEKFGFTLFGTKKETLPEEEEGVRFRALKNIDDEKAEGQREAFSYVSDLENLCEEFCRYAASELHLYYDIEDIRRFISGFAVSHLMIMQGLSGTGKTSLATAFGDFLNNRSTVISVQPMWKERSDVIGYFNEFTKQFNESALLKKLYEARFSNKIYIIVLDEMNIARVEYFFADFLSLMELNPDNRYLDMTTDSWPKDPRLFEKGRFRLPDNVWFIGTANNDDSTFAISDKVYDRAMVMNMNRKARPFNAPKTNPVDMSFLYFKQLVKKAESDFEMTSRARRKVAELDRCLTEHYHITYGNRIRKQMEEYVAVYLACGGTEMNALDDFLSKKILRKLENQNPIVISKAGKELEEKLNELFEEDSMPLCRSYLNYLKQLAS